MRRIKRPESRGRSIKVRRRSQPGKFWHLHAHSHYSVNDALSPVSQMVKTAVEHGQPALALTDHGNMGGAVQLYKAARKAGIAPFPGVEAYVTPSMDQLKAKRPQGEKIPRFHMCLVPFTTEGYQALVRLSSKSFTRERFYHKPHVEFSDFAEWAERGWTDGIAATTGCFFGIVQQAMASGNYDQAKWYVQSLAKWFPHLYVELQHHSIEHDGLHDDALVAYMAKLADETGLPCVITQDAHYCHEDEKPYHETLKQLVAYGDDLDDAVFPGDSFHLADEDWIRSHYPELIWRKGIEGLTDLLSKHTLQIPELEHYHYNVPAVTAGDAEDELADYCAQRLSGLGLDSDKYESRLDEELDVVEVTRMASYLLLVKEVCDWCNDHGVFFQTRGSASGSLICYLLGITQLDPLKWNLRYERFLSKDRTKPPDIDLDVEDTRRDDLIEWLRSRFNVCQIGTYATYSITHTGTQVGRGSLLVSFITKMRKQGLDVDHIESIYDLDEDTRGQLLALSSREVKKSTGTHAAGLVVTSTAEEFSRLVPTMLIPSSETTVTQYEMDDVEDLGLVKLDVLGLKTLTLMRRVIELIGGSVHEPLDWIPSKDKETFKALRRGDTVGLFQLEGHAMQKGCREMKVKSIEDIVVALALYRPATMSTGVKDSYINRRAKWEAPPQRHQILERNLSETHGLPVFQEQVVSILRDLGFSPEELTDFLKAVKASNKNIGDAGEVIHRYERQFLDLAKDAGWSDSDIQFAWQAIEGFAEYGFNRAHATGYGLTAYRMAYLKTHYPLEYAAALLEVWAGTQKEKHYVAAVREMGIRMLRPDVNVSGFSWTLDREKQAVRKGLLSIKGVGEKAAREISSKAPFESMEDLINRCDARAVNGGKDWHRDGTLKGVLEKLQDGGALRSLGVNKT